MKKCSKCGLEKDDSCFGKSKQYKGGLYSYCKQCRKEIYQTPESKITRKNYYESSKYKDYQQKPDVKENKRKNSKRCYENNREKTLISSYKRIDKKKGLVCDLTVEWMKENITNKLCTYCKLPGDMGCDRVDNNKGHTKDNCVPCHGECNKARGDYFSFTEMLRLGDTIRQIKMDRK